MSPPIRRQKWRLIASPRPVPPYLALVDWPRPGRTPRTGGQAAPRSCRSRCPRPRTSASRRARAPRSGVMVPWSVNLLALESRLKGSGGPWSGRRASSQVVGAGDDQRVGILLDQRLDNGRHVPHQVRTEVSRNRSIFPASILERSRMSLISPSRCLPAALIFWRSGGSLLAQVVGLFLEHLGVANDGVQGGT